MRPGRRWESDELELVVEEYMRMLADIRSQKPGASHEGARAGCGAGGVGWVGSVLTWVAPFAASRTGR